MEGGGGLSLERRYAGRGQTFDTVRTNERNAIARACSNVSFSYFSTRLELVSLVVKNLGRNFNFFLSFFLSSFFLIFEKWMIESGIDSTFHALI